jgi:hypothetical protein
VGALRRISGISIAVSVDTVMGTLRAIIEEYAMRPAGHGPNLNI